MYTTTHAQAEMDVFPMTRQDIDSNYYLLNYTVYSILSFFPPSETNVYIQRILLPVS